MSDPDYWALAMPEASINSPGTNVPEGNFPVGFNFGWHGGIHVRAPSVGSEPLPVCAIADGEIVFARQPTAEVADPTHPLNYNPFGSSNAWTDNGFVIIKHSTDIGDGGSAEGLVFYSLIAHLSELRGNALLVAKGTANASQRKLFRKEEIGKAGRIYGVTGHIHMEIICNDENCKKLIGRETGDLSVASDGRQDAIYGEIYFYVPSGSTVFKVQPPDNVVSSSTESETTQEDLVVGLRYARGDGPANQRGHAYVTTYTPKAMEIAAPIEIPDAEYGMYARAQQIANTFPATSRPAESGVYQMLRFGRILRGSPDTLPATVPHWRPLRLRSGQIRWVNVNATGIRKFSDADFPHWRGWKLIADDSDGDSRANSALLKSVIASAAGLQPSSSVAQFSAALSSETVRRAMTRIVCKFPGEWNSDGIDQRYGWLKSDQTYKLEGQSWEKFRAHVAALAVASESLPSDLVAPHWHFHPRTILKHLSQNLWLSLSEFKQIVPRTIVRKNGNSYSWENVILSTGASSILATQRVALNRMARQYGINSPLRLASFYGNSIQETTWLSGLREGGATGTWYSPWYGRGFLQLTSPGNYFNYWRFRGRQVPDSLYNALTNAYNVEYGKSPGSRSNTVFVDGNYPLLTSQMRNWRNAIEGATNAGAEESAYAPADSAGFYWSSLRMAAYADGNHTLERRVVTTQAGSKVFYRSIAFWRASASVNLPSRVDQPYHNSLNGFEARCVAYMYALSVLSDVRFPDATGQLTLDFPEGYQPRR